MHTCRNCKKELELNEVWVDNGGDLCSECVQNSVPCSCGCGRRVFVNPRLSEECWKKLEADTNATGVNT